MNRVVKDNEWSNVKEGVPAFMTMLLMPLTYSIITGIIAGIVICIALNLCDWVIGLLEWSMKARSAAGRVHQNYVETGPRSESPSTLVM